MQLQNEPLAALSRVETQFLELYNDDSPLVLECGQFLAPVNVAYETYGELNAARNNAILVCHALTASAHAAGYNSNDEKSAGWWNELIGPNKALDTNRYFVICSNILGGCYGTTGPTSMNPATGEKFNASFPRITIRDIVNVQKRLLDTLGVRKLFSVIGSSLGGMQVLEWAVMYPDFCETIIPISTSASQSAWCIALNAIARTAITNDPQWNEGNYGEQPAAGLSHARMLGMITYRTPEELDERFGRKREKQNPFDRSNRFDVESYLHYQGEKLVDRFDANTYLTLSHATDSHDLAVGRGPLEEVCSTIRAKALCVGVSSDIRYPTREQKHLAQVIPYAEYAEIESVHGHDAFLIEYDQLTRIIVDFFERVCA
jgi:homoserine O-acetyltransferase/O-succinyltransferase